MIIFTQHSLLKLHQRGLDRKLVLKALTNPDEVKQSYGKRLAAFKKFGKLYLKVIFIKENNNTFVITQHWVNKI